MNKAFYTLLASAVLLSLGLLWHGEKQQSSDIKNLQLSAVPQQVSTPRQTQPLKDPLQGAPIAAPTDAPQHSAATEQPVGATSASHDTSAGLEPTVPAPKTSEPVASVTTATAPQQPLTVRQQVDSIPIAASQRADEPQTLPASVQQPSVPSTALVTSPSVSLAQQPQQQEEEIQAKQEEKKRPPDMRITSIRVRRADMGASVIIKTASPATFKQSRLSNPERLILDLKGVWKVKAPGVPLNDLISNVRIGKYSAVTRIVIDLKKAPATVNVSKNSSGLSVRLR